MDGWLKYCVTVHFLGERRNILRVILGTEQ